MRTLDQSLARFDQRKLSTDCKKPCTIAEFEQYRPELVSFTQEALKTFGHKIIKAPVKSGKLEMMIYAALRNFSPLTGCQKSTAAIFWTSLNRVDTKLQKVRLGAVGIDIAIQSGQGDERLEPKLANLMDDPNIERIIVFFDESDYGTGDKQSIFKSGIMQKTINNPKISYWLLSATNEEVENSEFASRCQKHVYVPPPEYRGAHWFLEQSHHDGTPIVEEAQPFWKDGKLTAQGERAMDYLVNSDKSVGVLRLAHGKLYSRMEPYGKEHDAFMTMLKKYDVGWRFIDGKRQFVWDDSNETDPYTKNPFKKTLLICNQTCTRSTAVGFHEDIAFWHDYRDVTKNPQTPYNTIHQAAGRVFHFHSEGHKIKLFTSIKAMQFAADRISSVQLAVDSGMGLSNRITTNGIDRGKYDYDYHTIQCMDAKTFKQLTPPRRFSKIMAEVKEIDAFKKFFEVSKLNPRYIKDGFVPAIATRRAENVIAWAMGDLQNQSTNWNEGLFQLIVIDGISKSKKINRNTTPSHRESWSKAKSQGLDGKLIAIVPKQKVAKYTGITFQTERSGFNLLDKSAKV